MWKKPFLSVELHNTLFVEDYYMYDYFLSVWDKAQKISEHEFTMTDSDMYIYTMAHLAEHFTTGGACFRPTMDIYLMREKMSETLDFSYIEKEFQRVDKLAKLDTPESRLILDNFYKALAYAFHTSNALFDFSLIVLGGSVGKNKEIKKFLKKQIQNTAFNKKDISIKISTLENGSLEGTKFL